MLTALCVLAVFAMSGSALLRLFGVTIEAFQIAGGILFALLGLAMLNGSTARPAASAVILAERDSAALAYDGLAEAMGEGADIRIFAKPTSRPYRRMGVALATAGDTDEARRLARDAAHKVRITYGD